MEGPLVVSALISSTEKHHLNIHTGPQLPLTVPIFRYVSVKHQKASEMEKEGLCLPENPRTNEQLAVYVS